MIFDKSVDIKINKVQQKMNENQFSYGQNLNSEGKKFKQPSPKHICNSFGLNEIINVKASVGSKMLNMNMSLAKA